MLHVGGDVWLLAEDEQHTQTPYLHCKDCCDSSLHDYHLSSEAWLQHTWPPRRIACLTALHMLSDGELPAASSSSCLLAHLDAVLPSCTQALAMPGLPTSLSQN